MATGMKRMATTNASDAADDSANCSVFFHGNDEVIAAAGFESTVPADQGAQCVLIEARRGDEDLPREQLDEPQRLCHDWLSRVTGGTRGGLAELIRL